MSYEEKKSRVAQVITEFPFQCDFIISSFSAAISSHRFESRAVPFPTAFCKEGGEKDFESLRKLMQTIPPLSIAQKLLPYNGNFEYIGILDWLFTIIDPRSLDLTEINSDESPKLDLPIDNHPTIIFASKQAPDDKKAWNKRKGLKNTFHAFYGTSLENIYSILNHGLNPIFSTLTAPLYGEGIYLTNQMCVSLLFSPYAKIWKYSMLGDKMRVLVLCEVIDDSSKIKRLRKSRTPEEQLNCTYLIVKDAKYVRPKYFFLYVKTFPRNSLCSRENCLRLLYAMFIISLSIWIYANRGVLYDIVAPIFLN